MHPQEINHFAARALVILSIVALAVVLYGYTLPPQPDEGAAAHIFQISVLALVPTGLAFLATTDWKQPLRALRPLLLSAAILLVAFAALYCLEHCQ
ncbi:MAG TPA: hypothetical protein VFI95_13905 [Terriglobales bacterium]|nr:hypothetical protein [Terriglobales bacterium]